MTRVLSELLGAVEPNFRQGLTQLERLSGHPSADIRFSSEVMQTTKAKLRELGLDSHDTTGPELYSALLSRIKDDDQRLKVALLKMSHGRADEDLVSHIAQVLNRLMPSSQCFALKTTVARRILKKVSPKRTQKLLGYRSLDSMLKHESVFALIALAHQVEGVTWQRSLLDQYRKLSPTDFESRSIAVVSPNSQRWQNLADKIVASQKNNIVSLDELGAVVLMPLPEPLPGATITMVALALEAFNEIKASSTFLKLCQVKPDFGQVVESVAEHEPYLNTHMLDRAVSWQLIQRYYARFKDEFRMDVFEPHIQPSDLSWHSIEKFLSHIEPSLDFWQGTAHLALLHDRQPVSMNVLDAALNYCNQLPYAKRLVHNFRHSLMTELLLRYLKHDNVEHVVLGELQAELEPVLT